MKYNKKAFYLERKRLTKEFLDGSPPKFNLGDKVYGWSTRNFGRKNKNGDYQYNILTGNINEIIIRGDKKADRFSYSYGVSPFRRAFSEKDLFASYNEALASALTDFEFDF